MEKLHNAIERAKAVVDYSDDDELVLQEGAKAQSLLPLLDSLRDDEKFWTSEQIQEEMNQLTARIQNTEIIQDRIPMGRKLQRLKSLLERNGVTNNDRKPPGRSVASTRDDNSGVLEDAFYRKLVEVDSDDIVFKVHDLALLVSDVHHMKVFYTFINHLYRSNRISKDDRQRYALKALQKTSKTICKSDHQLMRTLERIVEKCREDGVIIHGIDNKEADSVAATTVTEPSVSNNIGMIEFRVGEMLPQTSTEALSTGSTHSNTIGSHAILAQAQALGRALKELDGALDANDGNGVSTAAICSVLNALSFGATIFGGVSSENVVTGLLDEIVDYGDVNHICLVVDQSDNEKLQSAFEQGIAIIERSNEKSSLKSHDEAKSGSSALATTIGHLANAVTKWTRDLQSIKADNVRENAEAISVMALVVTTKIIQAAAESVEHGQNIPSHHHLKGMHATNVNKRKGRLSLSGGESSSVKAPKIGETSTLNGFASSGTTSRSHVTETTQGGQVKSIVQRVTQLEATVSSLVEELKDKRNSDERMQQFELRICKLEKFLGYKE